MMNDEKNNINYNPFFSIIILFWNNKKYLERCLNSLSNQSNKDFEIIFINNGSTEPIDENLFEIIDIGKNQYLELSENIGFSGGNNYGAKFAKGEYLITLNLDAFPENDWLETIYEAIQKYPNCFFASKLIMADTPSRLDGTGDVYHFTGLVWRKYHGVMQNNIHIKENEVFSACAAAAVYPKDAFVKVGGFDDDYFAYLEDVDLGFRLRLLGYKCIFLPDAVVQHVGSGSTGKRSELSVYYGQRNLVWTFYKNMPRILFWVLLPAHIIANIIMIVLSIYRGQGKITIKAKVDAIKGLPKFNSKRKQVQKDRLISLIELMKVFDWNPISPLTKLFRG